MNQQRENYIRYPTGSSQPSPPSLSILSVVEFDLFSLVRGLGEEGAVGSRDDEEVCCPGSPGDESGEPLAVSLSRLLAISAARFNPIARL